ncbi:hypothetical protein VTK73DRAFT_8742 [Phialemonium thermophilum]|uniref:Uncharacterized protein n=1 Tax=Phialemonium thermophilum TaxID=223376 RepID=A0ABR3W6M4_9PEZI
MRAIAGPPAAPRRVDAEGCFLMWRLSPVAKGWVLVGKGPDAERVSAVSVGWATRPPALSPSSHEESRRTAPGRDCRRSVRTPRRLRELHFGRGRLKRRARRGPSNLCRLAELPDVAVFLSLAGRHRRVERDVGGYIVVPPGVFQMVFPEEEAACGVAVLALVASPD